MLPTGARRAAPRAATRLAAVRVLIFHGYLLHGHRARTSTTRNLAAALVRLGHEVHLLCQERAAARSCRSSTPSATGTAATLVVRVAARAGALHRLPARRSAGLLPVYVADRYEGFEARPFPDCTDDEVEATSRPTCARCATSSTRARPDVALANHLVMGPPSSRAALGGPRSPTRSRSTAARSSTRSSRTRSASCRPRARGSRGARGVLVGSRHTAERLWAAMDDPALPARTRLGPARASTSTRFAPARAGGGARRAARRWPAAGASGAAAAPAPDAAEARPSRATPRAAAAALGARWTAASATASSRSSAS